MPAAEWTYFMDDGEMSRQTSERMKERVRRLRRVFDALNRKVTPYEPDKELAPGITSVATYGHTPGHNSFIVASGNSKVYVQADVTNLPRCSRAIRAGTCSSTRMPAWPKRPAARSTTCWRPRR